MPHFCCPKKIIASLLPRHRLGVNVARGRYYFLLVRRDYMTGNLETIASRTLKELENKFDECEPWWGTQCRVSMCLMSLCKNKRSFTECFSVLRLRQTFLLPDTHELLREKKDLQTRRSVFKMFSPPKVPINRSRKRKEQCRKTTTAY